MKFQIALSFLCLYILGLTASQEPKCVTNKYVEESYTITLNSPQQDGDTLTWKCEEKVIYKRRKGKVDPAADVDDQGSLTLTNMSKSEACTYKAVHHDKDGKLIKEHSESICVLSRIPDPKLEVECSPSGVVTLHCGPKNLPDDITLTWFHNDIEMTDETSNPLKPQKHRVKDRYKCRLSNGPNAEDSNEETVSCEVSESKCVTNKYVGESYTITLNSPQQDGDTLSWKCDDTVIYRRRKGQIDPTANVDDQGSLTLTNISKSMACTYKAEHHDTNGKSLKVYSESFCVLSRIPVPKLEVECSPSGVVTLQCGPKNLPEDITLTWFHNDIEMTNEKSNPLKPQMRGVTDRYKCRLRNGPDAEDSNEETVSCDVSESKCVTNKYVGESYTITLNSPQQEGDTLTWKCDDTVIYRRRKGKIDANMAADVDDQGSLTLTNISKSMACTYKAEHHDENGKLLKAHSESLCVFQPKCVTNKYVGESYTITLNSPQQDGDTLTWKCEEKVIYKRRKGKVDPAADVDDQGSLTLTNMSKSEACTYKAEHHDKDGKLIKEHSESICVLSY